MGNGRTNSSGGVTLPLNSVKLEMFGNTTGEIDQKNSLALLQGNYTNSEIHLQQNLSHLENVKTYQQEENLNYSGFVIELDWNEEKGKGIMIRLGESESKWYATLFTISFNPESVNDNEQFVVSYLKNAFISNYGTNNDNSYKYTNLFKISENKYLFIYTNGTRLSYVFLTIDWDSNSVTVSTETYLHATNVLYFFAYLSEDKTQIMMFQSVTNTGWRYVVLNVNSTNNTCTIIKDRTAFATLVPAKVLKLSPTKYGGFCYNSTNKKWVLEIYEHNTTDNSMTLKKTIDSPISTGSSVPSAEGNGVTLEYNITQGYSVFLIGARSSMHEYDAIYKFDIEAEILTLITNLTNPWKEYMGKKRLRGADYNYPKGIVTFMGYDSTYTKYGWYGKEIFGEDYLSYFADGVEGIIQNYYITGQVLFWDDNFKLLFSLNEISNFTQGIRISRLGARIYQRGGMRKNPITTFPCAPSLILKDMSKWKKGIATVPDTWLLE